MFSDATQYDAATHTVTALGHARVFFDNAGSLFTIDLRGGNSHAPVQLSSASDVFTTVNVFPMSADGADAWVDVQGGGHDWAIRSTMAPTDAPRSVQSIAGAMRDLSTGFPQYFFTSLGTRAGTVVTPTTFQVVDASFNPVAQAVVSAMRSGDAWLGADPAQAGLGYLKVGSQVRALHWSAGAVSVDASALYTFADPLGSLPAVADASALYLTDGLQVLAVSDGVAGSVGAFSSLPGELVDAGNYLVATEDRSTTPTTTQAESMRKVDGLLTLLEPPTAGLQVLGASAQAIVLVGTPEAGQAFLLASGDNRVRQPAGSQFVGLVRQAAHALDQPAAPVALLSCTAAATTGFCAPGPLLQLDITAPGNATTLGTLATSSAWMRDDETAGIASSFSGQTFLAAPGGLGSDEVDSRDAWQLAPGAGGSLVRVTSTLD